MAPNGGIFASASRFWSRSYAPDYVGFALLTAAYVFLALFVTPFHRLFSLSDLSKSYPHALHERVPVVWNIIYAGVVPMGILVLWAVTTRPPFHKSHVTILGLLISLALASFITDVIKNAAGRPRPDLLSRCKPREGTPGNKLVDFSVCTETDHHTLNDGWRSFPSGHSSFSFSGLGYLSLFLAGQLKIFRPHSHLAGVLTVLAPLLGAALIAMSRLEDYRHDVWDVTAGSILGITVAWFSYRRYYPSLRRRGCDEPYPSRAELSRRTAIREGKRKDEELGPDDFELGSDDEADEESIPLNQINGSTSRRT